MNFPLKRQPAIDASIREQFAPWSVEAETAAVAAWRACDSFTNRTAADLRQERRVLLEMQDMIQRALDASAAQFGEVDCG